MSRSSEASSSTRTLDEISSTVASIAESSSQAPVKPQRSRPGLIAGSVIGALFMVIVFGVIMVMHLRERKKRTLALRDERQARRQARIETGKMDPAGEAHHDRVLREHEEGTGHFGSGLHA